MKSWEKKYVGLWFFSGHLKYLCMKASQVSWQAARADIYLKLVSLLIAYWKVGCLFIRVACDLFSMLTWHDVFRHPVIRCEWKRVLKSVPCSCVQRQELCWILGLLLPSLTASWLFRWHKMLRLSLPFFLPFFLCSFLFVFWKIFTKSHNVDFWIIGLNLHSCLTVCYQKWHRTSHASVSVVSRSERSLRIEMYVCASKKRFDFGADCRVVRLERRVFSLTDTSVCFSLLFIDHLHQPLHGPARRFPPSKGGGVCGRGGFGSPFS